jgi:hypothetical protein
MAGRGPIVPIRPVHMIRIFRVLILSAFALGSIAPLPAARPTVQQVLKGFDNPISCAFSPDGSMLYVVNSARGEYGWVHGKGAVSKVDVSADGTLAVSELKFTANLGGPMGIAVLPVDVGRYTAGTIFVSQGGAWVVDRSGELIRNSFDLETGVFAIDPASGQIVGKFLMGPGSAFSKSLGHGVVNPLGLGFDPQGNLFLCDGGSGGRNLEPPIEGRPAVIKIPGGLLEDIAANRPVGGIEFIDVSHVPTTAFWDHLNNGLIVTTGGGFGPLGGAIFRLPRGDFTLDKGQIETVGQGLSAVTGAFSTPRGTFFATVNSGEIREVRSKEKYRRVKLRPELYLLSPGALATKPLPDGRLMVVVTEQAGGGIADWQQRIQVLTFPPEM